MIENDMTHSLQAQGDHIVHISLALRHPEEGQEESRNQDRIEVILVHWSQDSFSETQKGFRTNLMSKGWHTHEFSGIVLLHDGKRENSNLSLNHNDRDSNLPTWLLLRQVRQVRRCTPGTRQKPNAPHDTVTSLGQRYY